MPWRLTCDRALWELFASGLFWLFCLWTLGLFRSTRRARPSLATCARLLAASLLCWFLAAPQLSRQIETSAPITILLDDSASLKRKLNDGASVWARSVELARVLEETARKRGVPISIRSLGGAKPRDVDEASKLAPNAPFSPLSRAGTCADYEKTARVFFFSDGVERVEKDAPTPEKSASNVDALAIGSTAPAFDLRLEDVAASSVVYSNERARLRAKARIVGASGDSSRCVASLWERRANESEPRAIWNASFDVALDASGEGVFEFDYEWEPDREEIASYWLAVVDEQDARRLGESFPFGAQDALDAFSETCVLNDVASFDVEPRDRKLRVLLIDEYAREEYRYLRELLRREEKVELRTILFAADARVRDADPLNLPFERLDRKRAESFDVIIVGDVPKERWQGKEELLIAALLRDDATTSIWLLGSSTAPDERIAPGEVTNRESPTLCGETEYWRPDATSAGRRLYGDLFDARDEIEWTRVTYDVAPNASSEVLATAKRAEEDAPVLIAASLGTNRVLWQGVDETWRLRTLADKSVYRRFVMRTLDYLTSSRVNEPRDAKKTTQADLFDLANDEKRRALIQEETNVEARADALARIAESTGGEALDLRDLDAEEATRRARAFFERRLDETRKIKSVRKTNLAPIDLVVPSLFLLLFLAWTLDVRRS